MDVLVMGGSQFNGLAVVRELARHGHRVSVLNRGKTAAELPRGTETLRADRNDAAALAGVLGGRTFDAIVDVSAYTPEHVRSMVDLFQGRTGHYVFISSTVIYAASDRLPINEDFPVDASPRQNDYGRNKIECEEILKAAYRESGFPMTVVALSMVFGPRNIVPDREQRMFARLVEGRPILIPGDGTVLTQVCQVDDQARALRMLLGNNVTLGKRYNLTAPDFVSAEGYVDICAAAAGVSPSKVFVPAPIMDAAFDGELELPLRQDMPADGSRPKDAVRAGNQWALSTLVQHVAPHIHRWNRNVIFDVARLKRDVGWQPEFDFASAVEHAWSWFERENIHASHRFDYTFEDALLAHVNAA